VTPPAPAAAVKLTVPWTVPAPLIVLTDKTTDATEADPGAAVTVRVACRVVPDNEPVIVTVPAETPVT